MKKILSIIALFGMLFITFGNSVYAVVGINKQTTFQFKNINNTKILNYKIKFDTKNSNHLLANIIILSYLKGEGYNINYLYNDINKLYGEKLGAILNKINKGSIIDNKKFKERLDEISDILGSGIDPNGLLDGFGVNINVGGDGKYNFGDFNPLNGGGKVGGLGNEGFGGGNFGGNLGSNAMAGGNETWDVYGSSNTRKNSHNGRATTSYSKETLVDNGNGEVHYYFGHTTRNEDGSVSGNSYAIHKHSDGTTDVSKSTWTVDSNGNSTKTTTHIKYDKDGNIIEKNTKTTKGMGYPDAPWNEGKDDGGTVHLPAGVAKIFNKINSRNGKKIVLGNLGGKVDGTGNNPRDREEGGNDGGNKPIGIIGGDDVTNWGINGKPIHTTYKGAKPTKDSSNINWGNGDGKSSFNANLQTKGFNPQNQNPWENQNGVNKNGFSIPELQEKISGLNNNKNINFNNLVVKTVNSRFPGCNKNDVKIGNTIWSSCDLKGKEENDNVKKFQGRWYFKGSSINNNICGEGYRLPTESELNKIDLWWYNKLNFNKKGIYRGYFIPGKSGAYVYTALDRYKRYIVKWVKNYDLNGGYYGPFYTTVSGLDTNDYYTVRCVKKDTNQQNENNQNNNKQQNQNSNMQQSQKYQYGDGIQRKYAKTRFPGCKENDIIIGNQVWAACNETKKLSQAYGPYGKATDKDEHGWTYGLLYNKQSRSKLCGYGYRLPTSNELKKLGKIKNIFNILKLTNKYFYHKFYSGYYYYYSSDSSTNGLAINLESGKPTHIYYYKTGYPVRCIRKTPVTAEELGQESNSNEQNGNSDQNNNSQQNLSSNDEYVNDKLSEINECFLNTYNSHLKNIDDTIKSFRNTMNSSKDEKTKKKYEKAIRKLEEIKRLFILRYKNILDYKN